LQDIFIGPIFEIYSEIKKFYRVNPKILFALFFYPLALAHLGVNDISDVANDQVKKMKTKRKCK